MTSDATASPAPFAQEQWEEEGRRIAPSLDGVAAAVVIGQDPDAAAAVALGVGRVQSRRRRVAIGDLVGEVGPLQSLVTGDDPHGIVDSFLYGVSLNRIAHPIDGSGNLFVLPSGSEPVVAEEIFRNERWGRLATGFRDVGALLLLVAPTETAGVDALVARVDGVVLAGRGTPTPVGSRVIALAEPPSLEVSDEEHEAIEHETVEHEIVEHEAAQSLVPTLTTADGAAPSPVAPEPARELESPVAPEPPIAGGDDVAPSTDTPDEAPARSDRRAARWVRRIAEAPPTRVNLPAVGPSADRGSDGTKPMIGWATPPQRRWPYALAAGVVVVLVGSALLSRDGGTRSEAGRRVTPSRATIAASDSLTAGARGDSGAITGRASETGGASAGTGVGMAATPGAPATAVPQRSPVSNPGDSALAAAYSVQIVAANTPEGARAKLRDVALGLPATVISPMSLGADSTRWYRLTVGAFDDRQAAITYLRQVRDRRKLDLEVENVVRLPYALLLADRVPRLRAKARVASYVARGLPAYALLQRDGTSRVYAGAFETPEQAGLLADRLRTAGIEPVVAYRTGRGF